MNAQKLFTDSKQNGIPVYLIKISVISAQQMP